MSAKRGRCELVLVIVAMALVLPGSGLANESEKESQRTRNHCEYYLAKRAPSGVDSFRILPTSNFGPSFAVRGLDRIFLLPKGPQLAFRLLRRLGLVLPTKKDQNFAPLLLFSEGKTIVPKEGHENALVTRYLSHAYVGDLAKDPVDFSEKRTEIVRNLFWRLIDEVTDTRSRKALSWVGGEIEAQFEAYSESRLTQSEFERNVERIIESISSTSVYLRSRRRWAPHFVYALLGEIPFLGSLMETSEYALLALLNRKRDLDEFRQDDSQVHEGYDRVPSTRTFSITNRDPLGFAKRADAFISGQLSALDGTAPRVAPDTPDYANALEAAYPDLMAIRHAEVLSVRAGYRVPRAWQRYGKGNFESDKAIEKVKLFFAVVLNQRDKFPGLSPAGFETLRLSMLRRLKLTENESGQNLSRGDVSIDAVDRALSFILSENIGRSLAPTEVAIVNEYGLANTPDQFTRLLFRLHHYPIASLYRHGDSVGQTLTQALEIQSKVDPGKMKQGELGEFAFLAVENATPYQVALVCFRSILSHAAIASMSADIKPLSDSDWLAYYTVQHSMTEVARIEGDNSREVYEDMLREFATQQEQTPFRAVQTRLAMLLRSIETGQAKLAEELLEGLEEKRHREIIERFLWKYPVDLHQFAELFGAICRKENRRRAGEIWILVVAKLLQWVEEDENFKNALDRATRERSLVRINVFNLVRYVSDGSAEDLLKEDTVEVRMFDGQYLATMPRDRKS